MIHRESKGSIIFFPVCKRKFPDKYNLTEMGDLKIEKGD